MDESPELKDLARGKSQTEAMIRSMNEHLCIEREI
jgi:hypothetical protein